MQSVQVWKDTVSALLQISSFFQFWMSRDCKALYSLATHILQKIQSYTKMESTSFDLLLRSFYCDIIS